VAFQLARCNHAAQGPPRISRICTDEIVLSSKVDSRCISRTPLEWTLQTAIDGFHLHAIEHLGRDIVVSQSVKRLLQSSVKICAHPWQIGCTDRLRTATVRTDHYEKT
jgi:hypothetical protein